MNLESIDEQHTKKKFFKLKFRKILPGGVHANIYTKCLDKFIVKRTNFMPRNRADKTVCYRRLSIFLKYCNDY